MSNTPEAKPSDVTPVAGLDTPQKSASDIHADLMAMMLKAAQDGKAVTQAGSNKAAEQ